MAETSQDAVQPGPALNEGQRHALVVLRGYLEEPGVRAEIDKCLPLGPAGLNARRVVRQLLTMVQNTPELLRCTHRSLLCGLMQASELGLDLSGVLGQAYLIPRWSKKTRCYEAVFQIGYRGLIELAYRSKHVRAFSCRVVQPGDYFTARYGTDPGIEHVPNFEAVPEGDPRPPPLAYYAVAVLRGGRCDFEIMTHEQMLRHQKRFAPDSAVWAHHFTQMALKTVAIRLCKRLPLRPSERGRRREPGPWDPEPHPCRPQVEEKGEAEAEPEAPGGGAPPTSQE